MASNKKLRRHLRRTAERKGLDYRDSIVRFYGKDLCDLNKSLLYSLHKRTKSSGS